jgi:hypothetical protein
VWEGDDAPGPDRSRDCVAIVERAHCGGLKVAVRSPRIVLTSVTVVQGVRLKVLSCNSMR